MDPVSQSDKAAIYGAAVRKERRKYSRRWFLIGSSLGMFIMWVWIEMKWPLWRGSLILFGANWAAMWVMDKDTK